MSESKSVAAMFCFVLQTMAEHSPTFEFEEFQTNPITHDVQDATTAETERKVQPICIVNSLGVFSTRVFEFSCECAKECETGFSICASHVCAPAPAYAIYMYGTGTCLLREHGIQNVTRYGFLVEFSADFPSKGQIE